MVLKFILHRMLRTLLIYSLRGRKLGLLRLEGSVKFRKLLRLRFVLLPRKPLLELDHVIGSLLFAVKGPLFAAARATAALGEV